MEKVYTFVGLLGQSLPAATFWVSAVNNARKMAQIYTHERAGNHIGANFMYRS